ncbi:MAG: PD40 domain-containing protein [candidate division Zixibacteria bacterium]|nr:PD40 domain-containing protein [candidate division Zixibacteria bacterium]
MPTFKEVRKQAIRFRNAIAPSWSPDGKWIAFILNDISSSAVYIISPDRKEKYKVYQPKGAVTMLTVTPGWSPDSKWLTFCTDNGEVLIADITGSQVKTVVGPGQNIAAAWSK